MARIPVESDAAFGTLLSSLTEDTVTASIHWRLCKDLWAAVPEFVREMNQSAAFWSLTLNAHREVALFRLGRLYDQQRGALSLLSLVGTIRANQHLFEEAHFRKRLRGNPFIDSLAVDARRPDIATLDEDARSVSDGSDLLVTRLVAMRNRVLAHRDPTIVLGASRTTTEALDAVEVDTLLERAASIVNRYSIMFRAGSHLIKIIGHDDFERLLRHVRDDLATRERRLVEEIERTERGPDRRGRCQRNGRE